MRSTPWPDSENTSLPEESSSAAMRAALRAAHAALDGATRRDEQGEVVGWLPLDGLSARELAEVVQLLGGLEATLRGLRRDDPEQLVTDSDRS